MIPALSAFLATRLIDRCEGHRRRVLAALTAKRRLNAASTDEVEAYQRERLAELLRHGAERIPFYRDKLPPPAEIHAANAREWLGRLPVLTRAQIQEQSEPLCDSAAAAVADATGGSTGTPMRFWVDRATQIARESSLMWADEHLGWRYGERLAMLWGSDRDVRNAFARGRTHLRWVIENRRWYNAFDMGEARMEQFHRALERFRPHIIVAYAGSAFLFARFLLARNLRPSYPLRGITVSAEVCLPTMRRTIEEAFGCPVLDRYGNREFGAIAVEARSGGGLRINQADCLVEAGQGAPGPLLVTYLHNRAMPFLRYDTGDRAQLLGGAELTPRLAGIEGRQSDIIRTADGRLIHGEYFTHLLYGIPGVRLFRFEQRTLTEFVLLVEGRRESFAAAQARVQAAIATAVGPGGRVRIELVDRLPPLPSGKHRFTVSLVTGQPPGDETRKG